MRPEFESRCLDWLSGKEFVCQCRRHRRRRVHHWFEKFLEKGMATHSSILAWEVPWTEEPGGLQFMGSQGIRQNLVTKQQQQLEIRLLWFLLLETVYV